MTDQYTPEALRQRLADMGALADTNRGFTVLLIRRDATLATLLIDAERICRVRWTNFDGIYTLESFLVLLTEFGFHQPILCKEVVP